MTQVLTEVAKEYVEVNKQNLAEWTKRRDSAGDAEFDEEQPPAKRVYTTDTTIEALHKMMADNPEGIFYLRDEMTGWLADLRKRVMNQTGNFTCRRGVSSTISSTA